MLNATALAAFAWAIRKRMLQIKHQSEMHCTTIGISNQTFRDRIHRLMELLRSEWLQIKHQSEMHCTAIGMSNQILSVRIHHSNLIGYALASKSLVYTNKNLPALQHHTDLSFRNYLMLNSTVLASFALAIRKRMLQIKHQSEMHCTTIGRSNMISYELMRSEWN